MNEDDMCQADDTVLGADGIAGALQSDDGGEAGEITARIAELEMLIVGSYLSFESPEIKAASKEMDQLLSQLAGLGEQDD